MNKKEQRAADKAAKTAAAIEAQKNQMGEQAKTEQDAIEQTQKDAKQEAAPKTKREPKPAKQQSVVLADGTTKTLPALPKLAKTRKPKPAKQCACGCGAMTKGGRFVTGHDSYLKSWCLRVERGVTTLDAIPDEGIRAAVKAHMQPKSVEPKA